MLLLFSAVGHPASEDWPQFGWDVASSGSSPAPVGINPSKVRSLTRHEVHLGGTVDASAIYLHAAIVKGSAHDVFVVTTSYGKTIAVDAKTGGTLWEFTPAGYGSWVGSEQITNSTPAADPDRKSIYATAPDGGVRKLALSDGHPLWTTQVTLLPSREKMASPLKVFRGRVIAVVGGYVGDAPPYQGHVAVLDAQTGNLLNVWNSLCSNRRGLLEPRSCSAQRSAIWSRAGAVIDPQTGNIFFATGNGPYDGKTNWSDSLIELDPEASRMLGNFTPADQQRLDEEDLDLGSTSPVLLGGATIAQGGKDASIRLLNMSAIAGTEPHLDHEQQTLPAPAHQMLYGTPAVWHQGSHTWMFAADSGGTSAWRFEAGKLVPVWTNGNDGTSPVVAGGLLYIYSPRGHLYVYDPLKGTVLADLPCGRGHWNSPIAVDGRIAVPEGNANDHSTAGTLDIWTLPER
jgi:outer membrane protein assembly factor BamB